LGFANILVERLFYIPRLTADTNVVNIFISPHPKNSQSPS